jgi:hypothetical protein
MYLAASGDRRGFSRSVAKNPDTLDALDQKVIDSHALLGWGGADPSIIRSAAGYEGAST